MTELLHTEQSTEATELIPFKGEFSDLKQELGKQKEKQDTPCPFPNHKGYNEVWKKLTPDQQKQMQENIRISSDGKIEIVKMKKKFSILTAIANNTDIFDGNYKDKNGKTGRKGVTYLTSDAAERECKKQNKKLLQDLEIMKFISFFPGEDRQEKIFNFVQLFGLGKSGYFDPNNKVWDDVGFVGHAKISRVNEYNDMTEVVWNNNSASITGGGYYSYLRPFVVYEDYIPSSVTKDGLDGGRSRMFMMLDGKKYTYDDLIKNFPQFKDDRIFKASFPGRERPQER